MGVSVIAKSKFENVTGMDTLISVYIKYGANAGKPTVCKKEMCKIKIHPVRKGGWDQNADTPDTVFMIKSAKAVETGRLHGGKGKKT